MSFPTVRSRVKGVIEEVTPLWNKKHQAWYRPGTSDLDMIKDCAKNYEMVYKSPLIRGSTVADLGANVGHFAKLALRAGARHVICIEADPANCDMIELNLREELADRRATLIQGAVLGKTCLKEVTFWTGNSARSLCSGSTVPSTAKRNQFTTPAIDFSNLNEAFNFQVVKCDIEGGEYELFLDNDIPSTVDLLALELHRTSAYTTEAYDRMVKKLEGEWSQTFRHDNVVFGSLMAVDFVFERIRANEPSRSD